MRENTLRKSHRTVTALLHTDVKDLRSRIRYRNQPRHTYIYCRSQNIAKRFLSDAQKEGFTFGDGLLPTQKEPSSIYALNDDFTISYTGCMVHHMFRNAVGNVVRIDYGKYITGARDWMI